MVEHQSCASLVNASALCAIEQDMKGDGMNSIAEISAELQQEKRRNAELMERISALEAQIQERNKEPLPADGQGCCENTEAERRVKKFKRQKVEASTTNGSADGNKIKREREPQVMHDTRCMQPKEKIPEDGLVNWMCMDETRDSVVECAVTDESDDENYSLCEEDDTSIDHITADDKVQEHVRVFDDGTQIQLGSSSSIQNVRASLHESHKRNDNKNSECMLNYAEAIYSERELKKHDRTETIETGGFKAPTEVLFSAKEISNTGYVSISQNRKPPKVAFCPKEVKKIMESEVLSLKNAQSHTIRKIIVFASLGIRHGCEDMYDLDFNHFSILSKGEPYVSPKNLGEHVLYENPGGRRKIFYRNRQNPTLCPVQILEEERNMRPSDTSCPSCLFLCIKYGGRTRNLPQNEYVRQRMGRNKLKSFGPVMCRMAMLVNTRSGSFFFKALGITLLFMAGFPDDLVQRETKYRNLDLLQKYYRRDEDTEGEQLFFPHLQNYDTQASIGPQQMGAKLKGKKQAHSTTKPHSLPKPLTQQSTPSSSTPPTQFGLMSYNSIHTHAIAAFQSRPAQTPAANPPAPYHMFLPQPANGFMPMMFWPPPSSFPPYPPSYGFRPLPSPGNYITFHQQPYYSHSLVPEMTRGNGKNDVALGESDSDSNSSSSSSGQRPPEASSKG